jgi:hypothetical protein
MGSLFAKAKRRYETSFQEAGKAINEKVRLYAKVGQALIRAKEDRVDPFAAIEQVVRYPISGWPRSPCKLVNSCTCWYVIDSYLLTVL